MPPDDCRLQLDGGKKDCQAGLKRACAGVIHYAD